MARELVPDDTSHLRSSPRSSGRYVQLGRQFERAGQRQSHQLRGGHVTERVRRVHVHGVRLAQDLQLGQVVTVRTDATEGPVEFRPPQLFVRDALCTGIRYRKRGVGQLAGQWRPPTPNLTHACSLPECGLTAPELSTGAVEL